VLGSSKAGTALQAFGLQFASGRMSEGSFNLTNRMGLIADPSKAEKVGVGQYMLPGAIDPKAADMATNQPGQYISTVLAPKMREFLKQYFGETYEKASPEEQDRMLYRMASQLSSRQTGANEIVEYLRNMLLQQRDRTAVTGALNRDAFAIVEDQNLATKVGALDAAWDSFGTSIFRAANGPITGALSSLKDLLNGLADMGRGTYHAPNPLDPAHPYSASDLGEDAL
jgi:hypothetical protein